MILGVARDHVVVTAEAHHGRCASGDARVRVVGTGRRRSRPCHKPNRENCRGKAWGVRWHRSSRHYAKRRPYGSSAAMPSPAHTSTAGAASEWFASAETPGNALPYCGKCRRIRAAGREPASRSRRSATASAPHTAAPARRFQDESRPLTPPAPLRPSMRSRPQTTETRRGFLPARRDTRRRRCARLESVRRRDRAASLRPGMPCGCSVPATPLGSRTDRNIAHRPSFGTTCSPSVRMLRSAAACETPGVWTRASTCVMPASSR